MSLTDALKAAHTQFEATVEHAYEGSESADALNTLSELALCYFESSINAASPPTIEQLGHLLNTFWLSKKLSSEQRELFKSIEEETIKTEHDALEIGPAISQRQAVLSEMACLLSDTIPHDQWVEKACSVGTRLHTLAKEEPALSTLIEMLFDKATQLGFDLYCHTYGDGSSVVSIYNR